MACATLYQCFNFLARHNGVISFTNHPDDPDLKRAAIKIDGKEDELVIIAEYPCTQEFPLLEKLLSPVCIALQDSVES